MIDKFCQGAAEALTGVGDGATVLVSGFGEAGVPNQLIEALIATGAADLTHRVQQRRQHRTRAGPRCSPPGRMCAR